MNAYEKLGLIAFISSLGLVLDKQHKLIMDRDSQSTFSMIFDIILMIVLMATANAFLIIPALQEVLGF